VVVGRLYLVTVVFAVDTCLFVLPIYILECQILSILDCVLLL
jgi:hypothetical protein